jgi:lysophospholipase L1-like esterase
VILMTMFRVRASAIVVSASLLATAGCGLFDKDESPTAPSAPGAPAANAPVRYTAIGASDAIGVGASVVCVPFSICENGTGYVPLLTRRVGATREVTLTNLGIPASVLSPTIHQIAQANGRDIPANFVDRELPFVPSNATLVTIFGGANDTNALAEAIDKGAAGNDLRGYIATQVRAFGADYDRLVRGVRSRAADAFIIVVNVPNMAGLPYASGYSVSRRQVLQAIAVGFAREANRQAAAGVVVLDILCDPQVYDRGRFSSDGFHPNDTGYAYLAERLLAIVNGATPPVAASCSQMSLVPAL